MRLTRRIFLALTGATTAAPKVTAKPSGAIRDPLEEYRLRVLRLDVQRIPDMGPAKTKLWRTIQR